MKKIISISFLLLLISSYTGATGYNDGDLNPVQTAVPLLTIAPDARGGGLGDVGAATSADVNSQYWNPAKYPFMTSKGGLGISYTPWLSKLVDDINLANLTGYWIFTNQDDKAQQAVSASLRYFSLGEVIFRQNPDESGIEVNPNELAIDFAYSRMLAEKWSAAVALRYIRSDLNTSYSADGTEMYPGNAGAADIAVFFNNPLNMSTGTGNLAFGLDISNIGTKITYDKGTNNYFLPANLRLGGSFLFPFDDFNKLSLNADINKLLVPTPPQQGDEDYDEKVAEYNDMSSINGIFKSFSDAPGGFKEEMQEIMWSVGLEYSYNKQFFVRAGYFNEAKNKGNRKYFTAGVGFKLNVFELDAAYVIAVSQSNPLDQTLRFSLLFDLGGLKSLVK